VTVGTDQIDACSIDYCTRRRVARGWCNLHWRRWRKHGDPEGGGRHYSSPEESFVARTERIGDCLVWTGSRNGDGYGTISWGGSNRGAHRYAWEREHGPIPEGMKVDHKCWNRACVEISHLRLATHAQNLGNRAGANSNSVSGIRGVREEPSGVYAARIDRGGVRYASRHASKSDAIAWLERAKEDLYGPFGGRLVNPERAAQ